MLTTGLPVLRIRGEIGDVRLAGLDHTPDHRGLSRQIGAERGGRVQQLLTCGVIQHGRQILAADQLARLDIKCRQVAGLQKARTRQCEGQQLQPAELAIDVAGRSLRRIPYRAGDQFLLSGRRSIDQQPAEHEERQNGADDQYRDIGSDRQAAPHAVHGTVKMVNRL